MFGHCDWNLNFIHRLVYIRPVMYSNRTIRILRVHTYYNPSAMLPIIPTISIAIIRPKFGRCKLRRFYQGMCVSHRKVTRSNSNFHSSFQLDQFSPITVCEQCYNIMNSYEENCYIVDAELCTDFSIVTTMGITCVNQRNARTTYVRLRIRVESGIMVITSDV